MPPRLALALAVLTAGLLLAADVRGGAPPPGPFAAGEGKAFAYAFEFGAVRSRLNGSLSGRGAFDWSRRPRGSIRIRVTCLSIEDNTAVIGGEIVRRTGRRVPKAIKSVTFAVEDRTGARRVDRISRLQLRTGPASCSSRAQGRLGSLRSGDVAVSAGTPAP